MKRTIVITGATSGFGHAIVKEFLRNGDRVIATGRNLTKRTEVFLVERESFKDALIEKDLDVTVESECINFVNYLEESHHNVDVLINNAGYGLFGALEDLSLEQIRHQFEVNFFGLVRLTQLIVPTVIRSKGKIFNFSSVFGFVGFPLSSVYCASKFAVEGLSESLDYELRPHGVQVCLIEPGGYRTKFGTSSVWGSQGKKTYELQTKNYQMIMNKMQTRKNFQTPESLATGLYKLSVKKNLPLRVPFGKDAVFTSTMKSFIPASVMHMMTHKVLGKIFLKHN
jgi:short-subunit dehydrogenase